nr:hypothetical protein JBOKJLJH_00120 [Enterobacter asburiae]
MTGLISGTELDEAEHLALKEHHLREMTPSDTAMHSTGLKTIYSEANQRVCGDNPEITALAKSAAKNALRQGWLFRHSSPADQISG